MLRLAKLSFPMILASSALACVAPTGDDSLGSGSESLTANGVIEPAILLERDGCDDAKFAETKLIVQKAVAAALKGADLKGDGNPWPAFDYKVTYYPEPGQAPFYPYADVICRDGKTLAAAWLEGVNGGGIGDTVSGRAGSSASRIVGGVVNIVDHARLSCVEQFSQQSTAQQRQLVPFFPRVDFLRPGGAASDSELGRLESTAAERDPAIDGQDLAHPLAIGADHGLRIGLPTHFPHRFDDGIESSLPVILSRRFPAFPHNILP